MSNAKLSKAEYDALLSALGDYLEAGHGAACMDDAEDRLRGAEGVVNWLLADREDTSTKALLPKARYFMSFLVVDESTGEHIVRMTLRHGRWRLSQSPEYFLVYSREGYQG